MAAMVEGARSFALASVTPGGCSSDDLARVAADSERREEAALEFTDLTGSPFESQELIASVFQAALPGITRLSFPIKFIFFNTQYRESELSASYPNQLYASFSWIEAGESRVVDNATLKKDMEKLFRDAIVAYNTDHPDSPVSIDLLSAMMAHHAESSNDFAALYHLSREWIASLNATGTLPPDLKTTMETIAARYQTIAKAIDMAKSVILESGRLDKAEGIASSRALLDRDTATASCSRGGSTASHGSGFSRFSLGEGLDPLYLYPHDSDTPFFTGDTADDERPMVSPRAQRAGEGGSPAAKLHVEIPARGAAAAGHGAVAEVRMPALEPCPANGIRIELFGRSFDLIFSKRLAPLAVETETVTSLIHQLLESYLYRDQPEILANGNIVVRFELHFPLRPEFKVLPSAFRIGSEVVDRGIPPSKYEVEYRIFRLFSPHGPEESIVHTIFEGAHRLPSDAAKAALMTPTAKAEAEAYEEAIADARAGDRTSLIEDLTEAGADRPTEVTPKHTNYLAFKTLMNALAAAAHRQQLVLRPAKLE